MFDKLQQVGKAFMMPIAILPVAGLMIGIGSAFTNPITIELYNLNWLLSPGSFLNQILVYMNAAGQAVFANLPLIFAIGIGFGLAKREKGATALSAAVAFLVMHAIINEFLKQAGITADTTTQEYFMTNGMTEAKAFQTATLYGTELGFFTVKVSVFGGILVGLITA